MRECSDVTELFEVLEERLVYVDAPVEGFLRSKSGELYAFRCGSIIDGCLWHWVLLPVPALGSSVEAEFDRAGRQPPDRWVSIVEDRRGVSETARVTIVELDGTAHPIPRGTEAVEQPKQGQAHAR